MVKKQLLGRDFSYKNLSRVMFKHISSSEEERDYEHLEKPREFKDAVQQRLKELVKVHYTNQEAPRRKPKQQEKDSQKSKQSDGSSQNNFNS